MDTNARGQCCRCTHRASIPGSAHSRCVHPSIGGTAGLEALMVAQGIAGPVAQTLGVRCDAHGLQRGWFSWPLDFDPAWLLACNGFLPAARPGNAQPGDGVR